MSSLSILKNWKEYNGINPKLRRKMKTKKGKEYNKQINDQ